MSTPAQSTDTQPATDLKALLQEAEQALNDTAGPADEKFDDLRARLRVALANGRFSIDRLRIEAVRRARQADQIVRENPYYAIGVAAGAGALVGILVSRSCRSAQ